jgi:hypothetical protein
VLVNKELKIGSKRRRKFVGGWIIEDESSYTKYDI